MAQAEAYELKVFVDNDSTLYHQRYIPMVKNLCLKMVKGNYLRVRAADLFMYLADAGAKKYAQEFGDGQGWNKMFDVATRRQVATEWAEEFETEFRLGNYDQYVPAKYKKKA